MNRAIKFSLLGFLISLTTCGTQGTLQTTGTPSALSDKVNLVVQGQIDPALINPNSPAALYRVSYRMMDSSGKIMSEDTVERFIPMDGSPFEVARISDPTFMPGDKRAVAVKVENIDSNKSVPSRMGALKTSTGGGDCGDSSGAKCLTFMATNDPNRLVGDLSDFFERFMESSGNSESLFLDFLCFFKPLIDFIQLLFQPLCEALFCQAGGGVCTCDAEICPDTTSGPSDCDDNKIVTGDSCDKQAKACKPGSTCLLDKDSQKCVCGPDSTCTPTGPNEIGLCSDGIDNDCDASRDCSDPDCARDPACSACIPTGAEVCDDKGDNDCDGDVDCADSDCSSDPFCMPATEICGNCMDDNFDDNTDCDDKLCSDAVCTGADYLCSAGQFYCSSTGSCVTPCDGRDECFPIGSSTAIDEFFCTNDKGGACSSGTMTCFGFPSACIDPCDTVTQCPRDPNDPDLPDDEHTTICGKSLSYQSCLCGNGQFDEGEECDDGNTLDGDGCSHDCKTEAPPPPPPPRPR